MLEAKTKVAHVAILFFVFCSYTIQFARSSCFVSLLLSLIQQTQGYAYAYAQLALSFFFFLEHFGQRLDRCSASSYPDLKLPAALSDLRSGRSERQRLKGRKEDREKRQVRLVLVHEMQRKRESKRQVTES